MISSEWEYEVPPPACSPMQCMYACTQTSMCMYACMYACVTYTRMYGTVTGVLQELLRRKRLQALKALVFPSP